MRVFVSSVNMCSVLCSKHCANWTGQTQDDCDPASAWGALRVGRDRCL